jgi:hypothetical protein
VLLRRRGRAHQKPANGWPGGSLNNRNTNISKTSMRQRNGYSCPLFPNGLPAPRGVRSETPNQDDCEIGVPAPWRRVRFRMHAGEQYAMHGPAQPFRSCGRNSIIHGTFVEWRVHAGERSTNQSRAPFASGHIEKSVIADAQFFIGWSKPAVAPPAPVKPVENCAANSRELW